MAAPADKTDPNTWTPPQLQELTKVVEALSKNDEVLARRSKMNQLWLLSLTFVVVVLGVKALE